MSANALWWKENQSAPLTQAEVFQYDEPAKAGRGGLHPVAKALIVVVVFLAVAAAIVIPVVLTLPESISCHPDDAKHFVKYAEAPDIESVYSPLVCTDQSSLEIAVRGRNFLEYNGKQPEFRVDSEFFNRTNEVSMHDCTPFGMRKQSAQLCSEARFMLRQHRALDVEYPVVETDWPDHNGTHPAAQVSPRPCYDRGVSHFMRVPEPKLFTLSPPLTCWKITRWDFTGLDLFTYQNITVNVSNSAESRGGVRLHWDTEAEDRAVDNTLFNVTNCTTVLPLPVPSFVADVQRCANVETELNATMIGVHGRNHTWMLRNPKVIGCRSDALYFEVHPPPDVHVAVPHQTCTQRRNHTIDLVGADFARNRTSLEVPRVTFDGIEMTVIDLDRCGQLVAAGEIELCSLMTIDLPAETPLTRDVTIEVHNPPPLDCSDPPNATLLAVPDAPIQFHYSEPHVLCANMPPRNITVYGDGFYSFDDPAVSRQRMHSLTFNETAITEYWLRDCRDDLVLQQSWSPNDPPPRPQTCRQMEIFVNPIAYGLGPLSLEAIGEFPLDCVDSRQDNMLWVVEAPVLTASSKYYLCPAENHTLQISGTDLAPNITSFYMIDSYARNYSIPARRPAGSTQPVFVPALETSIDEWALLPDNYTLTARNGPGLCERISTVELEVPNYVITSHVEPAVVWNAYRQRVILHTTGLEQAPAGLRLVPASGSGASINVLAGIDADDLTRLDVRIDAGTAAGRYVWELETVRGCVFRQPTTFEIVSTTSGTALQIALPQTVFTRAERLPVRIEFAPGSAPATNNDVDVFYKTPAQSRARPLSSHRLVQFNGLDALEIGLPVHTLSGDVEVYVVDRARRAVGQTLVNVQTTGSQPFVRELSPTSLRPSSGLATLTLYGVNMPTRRNAADFLYSCKTSPTAATFAFTDRQVASVTSATASIVVVRVQTNQQLAAGMVCAMTVKNGVLFDQSTGFTVTDPAKTTDFSTPFTTSARTLVDRRRAAQAGIARASTNERFFYVVGGDTGVSSRTNNYDTTEFASIDRFSALGEFVIDHAKLPDARTLHEVIGVDKYLYLFGGNNGTTVVGTVHRARVVQREDTVLGLDWSYAMANATEAGYGLAEGTAWRYTVAATFNNRVEVDEALPAVEVTAHLPTIPDAVTPRNEPVVAKGFRITLTWQAHAPATGYHVYRDGVLWANLTGGTTTTWTDFGNVTAPVNTANVPRRAGSLGPWLDVNTMIVDREDSAIATVRNPDPSKPHELIVYVFGGLANTGQVLASYQWMTISRDTDIQPVTAWSLDANTFIDTRTGAGAVAITRADNAFVPADEAWLFFMGGWDGKGIYQQDVLDGRLRNAVNNVTWSGQTCGANPDTPCKLNPGVVGGCMVEGAGKMFLVGGGFLGNYTSGGTQAGWDRPPSSDSWALVLTGATLPAINRAPTKTPTLLNQARAFHSCVSSNGLVFAVGGTSRRTQNALRSVEYVLP